MRFLSSLGGSAIGSCMSHTVVAVLLAEASGGSLGTVFAAGGELAGKVLTNTLTGGDPLPA